MEMSLDFWITQVLTNFSLAMFLLAILFILFHTAVRIRYVSFYEIVYRWMALFALGFTGIFTFVMHAFYADTSAAMIGWSVSPFQYEVAMADLALGVLGVFAFKASFGFRLATVIAAVVILWGDASGHLYQMIVNGNFDLGNAGTWFWLDLIVPLILLICIGRLQYQA